MLKRLSLLNGLAILAVVINHATQWGLISMFQSTGRGSQVVPVGYSLAGVLTFYALVSVERLMVFSVPAFLFFSGFFSAYAARAGQVRTGRSTGGAEAATTWKIVRVRIIALLIPYLIWSAAVFLYDASQGVRAAPVQYVARLIYGGAMPEFYFVPLLCQFYLLSPLLVTWVKQRGRLCLILAGAMQLGMTLLGYLGLVVRHPILGLVLSVARHWSLFPMWAFFFVLGVYAAHNTAQVRVWTARLKWPLLAATLVFGVLAIVEAELVYRASGPDWRDSALTLPASLYALSFLGTYLAFEPARVPFAKAWAYLSNKTFGIYLIHARLLAIAAGIFMATIPWIVNNMLAFQLLLIACALGIPLLLMAAVARCRNATMYHYLFG